jgi:WD40 repeat protein
LSIVDFIDATQLLQYCVWARWIDPKGRLEHVRSFTGHKGSVRSFCLTPDRTHLITCSMDKTVRKWDLSTGEERSELTQHFTDDVWDICANTEAAFCVLYSGQVRITKSSSARVPRVVRFFFFS